ncbi:hypothetical protein LTR12_000062 [Friedmanniomyces endolithicus]|nr:hypothetical protein LTR74_003848 [Friedmanniomyces endolithicus]KAK1825262.1 hypothetical protein LTR12_000062 [Friedmanniomyces endolithicus]
MIQKYNAASASSAGFQQNTGRPMEPRKAGGGYEDQETVPTLLSAKKRVRFVIDAGETSAEPDEDAEWIMVDVDAELKATTDNKNSRGILQAYKAFLCSRKRAFWPER